MNKNQMAAKEIEAMLADRYPGTQIRVTVQPRIIDWGYVIKNGLKAGVAIAVAILVHAAVHGLI